jgi:hypothetical protein
MYIHQKMDVLQVNSLSHLANLLMVFMPPAEIFQVLKAIVNKTWKIKNGKNAETEVPLLRWHIPADGAEHG